MNLRQSIPQATGQIFPLQGDQEGSSHILHTPHYHIDSYMCCHIVYVIFLYHSFHSFYFGTVSYISVFSLSTFPLLLSLCVSFHLLHAVSYMISDERRCQESHWAEPWGMWLRQSALHSGGPNFKASLHPSTNCGQAAKVSVGEELFTGLFSVSSLLMREPCQKRGFVCQNRARLL